MAKTPGKEILSFKDGDSRKDDLVLEFRGT